MTNRDLKIAQKKADSNKEKWKQYATIRLLC